MARRICSIPGCEKFVAGRGWCNTHYERWRLHGSPMADKPVLPPKHAQEFIETAAIHAGDECLIWPFARKKDGYASGSGKNVCRVICEKANGPPPTSAHEAAHICGRGSSGCVSGSHLRWATKIENEADKARHGTTNRGERSGHAKLTNRQVAHMREIAVHHPTSRAKLAAMFGVAPSTVSDILAGKRYNAA